MSYDLKKDKSGQFTFNLKAGNGQVILTGQSYASKQGAQDGIASVRAHGADDANFELKTSVAGEPFFVLKAKNGQIIGKSEMYSSTGARDNGVASVKSNSSSTTINDLTGG